MIRIDLHVDVSSLIVSSKSTPRTPLTSITLLNLNNFLFLRISAPDKYIVDSKEKSFKLTDNGEIFEATVYNEAKTLPVTGGSLSLDMLIVLMVAGFSIVGFTTMKVVKEKKEHNL